MNNIEAANEVLKKLESWGVQSFCVSPGGRNAPFIEAFSEVDYAHQCHYFFDERAAGFFALGRAKREKKPVVVITTSGTAVSELLSSAVEAKYSQVPLIFLTCDRPRSFRMSGAPQVVNQTEYLSGACEAFYDIQEEAQIANLAAPDRGPIHINISFGQPLLTGEFIPEPQSKLQHLVKTESDIPSLSATEDSDLFQKRTISLVKKFESFSKVLLVLGVLTDSERAWVHKKFGRWKGLYFQEGEWNQSVLPKSQRIIEGQTVLDGLDQGEFQGILRLGSVPVNKFWRRLSEENLLILSLTSLSWPGVPGGQIIARNCDQWPQLQLKDWSSPSLVEKDKKILQKRYQLLGQFPRSEPSFFRALTEIISQEQRVFLGNSLPIRNWLENGVRNRFHHLTSSRGANGIDGQIATWLGGCKRGEKSFGIFGDLTFLYDLNSLSQGCSVADEQKILNLFVVNNSGGQIFRGLFENPNFINPQTVDFSKIAEGFGCQYSRVEKSTQISLHDQPGLNIIELVPDQNESDSFRKGLMSQ